jgi:hypothetical protein
VLLTPSQVKNIMRRGLRLLVDPNLEHDERLRITAFFENRCAYCGTRICKPTSITLREHKSGLELSRFVAG